jgi:hypothetical protein
MMIKLEVALLGLANEHGSNAKTHEKESAKAIEQVDTALQLQAVAVDNRNSHDCNDRRTRGMQGTQAFACSPLQRRMPLAQRS